MGGGRRDLHERLITLPPLADDDGSPGIDNGGLFLSLSLLP